MPTNNGSVMEKILPVSGRSYPCWGARKPGLRDDFVGKFLRQIITENIKDALPKFTTLKVYKKGSLPERPLIIIKT